jgi:hypothetical protein
LTGLETVASVAATYSEWTCFTQYIIGFLEAWAALIALNSICLRTFWRYADQALRDVMAGLSQIDHRPMKTAGYAIEMMIPQQL